MPINDVLQAWMLQHQQAGEDQDRKLRQQAFQESLKQFEKQYGLQEDYLDLQRKQEDLQREQLKQHLLDQAQQQLISGQRTFQGVQPPPTEVAGGMQIPQPFQPSGTQFINTPYGQGTLTNVPTPQQYGQTVGAQKAAELRATIPAQTEATKALMDVEEAAKMPALEARLKNAQELMQMRMQYTSDIADAKLQAARDINAANLGPKTMMAMAAMLRAQMGQGGGLNNLADPEYQKSLINDIATGNLSSEDIKGKFGGTAAGLNLRAALDKEMLDQGYKTFPRKALDKANDLAGVIPLIGQMSDFMVRYPMPTGVIDSLVTGAWRSMNPDIRAKMAEFDAQATQVARQISGERGATSERDTQRAKGLIVDNFKRLQTNQERIQLVAQLASDRFRANFPGASEKQLRAMAAEKQLVLLPKTDNLAKLDKALNMGKDSGVAFTTATQPKKDPVETLAGQHGGSLFQRRVEE